MKRAGRLVAVTNDILGRQFSPYLQGMVVPGGLMVDGQKREMLLQTDPLNVDPTVQPKESWQTEVVHPIKYLYQPYEPGS